MFEMQKADWLEVSLQTRINSDFVRKWLGEFVYFSKDHCVSRVQALNSKYDFATDARMPEK